MLIATMATSENDSYVALYCGCRLTLYAWLCMYRTGHRDTYLLVEKNVLKNVLLIFYLEQIDDA